MRDGLLLLVIGILLALAGFAFGATDINAWAHLVESERAVVMVIMGEVTALFGLLLYETEEKNKEIRRLRARLRRIGEAET